MHGPVRPRNAASNCGFSQARQLAAEHGTPLLVLAPRAVGERYQELTQALPNVELAYAVKANGAAEVLRTLAALGAAAEVSSQREAEGALAAGFAAERCWHSHPCPAVEDVTACAAAGMRWFTCDSREELEKIARCAPEARVLLRLATPRSGRAIDLSQRFGARGGEALELVEQAARAGLPLGGLAFHVGSQCLDPAAFLPALVFAREVWDVAARAGLPMEILNLGGGFPAPYREPVLALEEYCRPIRAALAELFGDLPCRIIAEPGRALVAEAATLVTRVVSKRRRDGGLVYTLDDGIYGTLSSAYYDQLDLPIVVERTGPLTPATLAGPTCAPQDIVARGLPLPELEVGDLVLIPSTGAYAAVRSTEFNGMRPAKMVVVNDEFQMTNDE